MNKISNFPEIDVVINGLQEHLTLLEHNPSSLSDDVFTKAKKEQTNKMKALQTMKSQVLAVLATEPNELLTQIQIEGRDAEFRQLATKRRKEIADIQAEIRALHEEENLEDLQNDSEVMSGDIAKIKKRRHR